MSNYWYSFIEIKYNIYVKILDIVLTFMEIIMGSLEAAQKKYE